MKGILVAVSPEGIIGKNNTIPWHYSADLKRFKRLTTGKTIIMGRKTWESLPVKPLPNRRNIVISRSSLENVDCFQSIDEALKTCEGDIWINKTSWTCWWHTRNRCSWSTTYLISCYCCIQSCHLCI